MVHPFITEVLVADRQRRLLAAAPAPARSFTVGWLLRLLARPAPTPRAACRAGHAGASA